LPSLLAPRKLLSSKAAKDRGLATVRNSALVDSRLLSFSIQLAIEPRRALPRIQLRSWSVYGGMWTKRNGESSTGPDHYKVDDAGEFSAGPLGQFEYEVDQASTLVHEVVARLSRHRPGHAIGGAASEDLQRMRPRFEGALAALAEIESHRALTQTELSRRRAFKMLLEG
jgi:hypothetical protein